MSTNLALEARMGICISNDSVTASSGAVSVTFDDLTVDIERYYGLYAKYFVPITDNLSFYGTAGYTEVELTFTAPNDSVEDNDDDFSFVLAGLFH